MSYNAQGTSVGSLIDAALKAKTANECEIVKNILTKIPTPTLVINRGCHSAGSKLRDRPRCRWE